ncbi:hypothetical protein ABH944_002891 [Caballeronia udeis]|uniref:Uncharacterized protein n=1 Tax=Caballeronia udeis TaxID=1232866 RepID=A0ABW8MJZ1_9BURK
MQTANRSAQVSSASQRKTPNEASEESDRRETGAIVIHSESVRFIRNADDYFKTA